MKEQVFLHIPPKGRTPEILKISWSKQRFKCCLHPTLAPKFATFLSCAPRAYVRLDVKKICMHLFFR